MVLVPDPDIKDQPSIEDRLDVLVSDVYRERDTFMDLSSYNGD